MVTYIVKEYFINDDEFADEEMISKKFDNVLDARKYEEKKIREFVSQNIDRDVESHEHLKHYPNFRDWKKEVKKILKNSVKLLQLYSKLNKGSKIGMIHRISIEIE